MYLKTKHGLIEIAALQLLAPGDDRAVVMLENLLRRTAGGIRLFKQGSIWVLWNNRYSHYETLEDLLSALRQMIEKYTGRRGELAQIARWRQEIASIMAELLDFERHWTEEEAASLIMTIGQQLAGSRSPRKQAAKRSIIGAASPLDARGRVNGWLRQKMMGRADLRLTQRILEAERINAQVVARLVGLAGQYGQCLQAITCLRDAAKALASELSARRSLASVEQAVFADSCRALLDLLRPNLLVEPFVAYRYLTIGDLNRAVGALLTNRVPDAVACLERVHSGSRIMLAHSRLERIRFDFALEWKSGRSIDVEKAEARLTAFLENLNDVDVRRLTAENVALVRAAVQEAIVSFRQACFSAGDSQLDRAIRLL